MSNRAAIHTEKAPEAIGTYSQAIKCGTTVYLSGQIPLDLTTKSIVEGTIETRVEQALINIKHVAEAAGGKLDDLVKINVYLTDLAHFSIVNDMMAKYFNQPYPARAAIGVNSLPMGADVEMDGILEIR